MEILDTIIIGGGPGGLTAAIYAARSELKHLVIEKLPLLGGSIINTDIISNYPGFINIDGFSLGNKFKEHALSLGSKIIKEEVKEIKKDLETNLFYITTNKNKYVAKTIVLATGARHANLNLNNEESLIGKGISYCATCDGPLYKDKVVAIVGGGNTALEEALFLSKLAKKVYIIHRRDEYRAEKIQVSNLRKKDNVVELLNYEVKELLTFEGYLNQIKISNNLTYEVKLLDIDALFVAIGVIPNTELVKDLISLDNLNYAITNEYNESSLKGLYIVGDIKSKGFRQVITACSDGSNAIHNLTKYIENNF